MTSTLLDSVRAAARTALPVAIGAIGIYVAYVYGDDPSLSGLGPAGVGMLLMIAGVVLGIRAARSRLPTWAAGTALALGILIAVVATLLIRAAALTAPLFPQAQDVPSVVDSTPSPQYTPAVERSRALVRAAMLEQNLPAVSVAVGVGLPSEALAKEGGTIVWSEGFGWRDVQTRTPARPNTRFNIGTAAPVITGATVARLGLTHTGADAAKEWSPEAIGEEGEDFPPLTVLRHIIWQPLGVMPAEYPLPGERATFYVARSDDDPRRGRRLMYMRDLACSAGTMASYSTAPDLVRVGMATGTSVNGMLAGGMVMSLTTLRDRAIVVAVLSNIAHANTAAIAGKIRDSFAEQGR